MGEDHMTAPRYNTERSYTIDITGHGLKALQYCKATEIFDDKLIKFKGLKIHRPVEDSEEYTEPGWTGSRGDICRALQEEIAKYPGRIKIEFETKVAITDIYNGKIACTKGEAEAVEANFDLIVGCDGA